MRHAEIVLKGILNEKNVRPLESRLLIPPGQTMRIKREQDSILDLVALRTNEQSEIALRNNPASRYQSDEGRDRRSCSQRTDTPTPLSHMKDACEMDRETRKVASHTGSPGLSKHTDESKAPVQQTWANGSVDRRVKLQHEESVVSNPLSLPQATIMTRAVREVSPDPVFRIAFRTRPFSGETSSLGRSVEREIADQSIHLERWKFISNRFRTTKRSRSPGLIDQPRQCTGSNLEPLGQKKCCRSPSIPPLDYRQAEDMMPLDRYSSAGPTTFQSSAEASPIGNSMIGRLSYEDEEDPIDTLFSVPHAMDPNRPPEIVAPEQVHPAATITKGRWPRDYFSLSPAFECGRAGSSIHRDKRQRNHHDSRHPPRSQKSGSPSPPRKLTGSKNDALRKRRRTTQLCRRNPSAWPLKDPFAEPPKIYRCDNLGCGEWHSHYDCPLPQKCRGCHSTSHYSARCSERCSRCRAIGHKADYCRDFESKTNGMSVPRRTREENASQSASYRKIMDDWRRQTNRVLSPIHRGDFYRPQRSTTGSAEDGETRTDRFRNSREGAVRKPLQAFEEEERMR